MEKISSPRARWKWSLGLGQHLKGAWSNVGVRSSSTREIKNATISEFSTFLKINKSREHLSFTVNSFLPYLRLTTQIFEFLLLSTKCLAVLRLSVNPTETLKLVCLNSTKTKIYFSQTVIDYLIKTL